MNTKTLLMVALSGLAANTASAGTNIWTSGWAMGTAEYAVDDGSPSGFFLSFAKVFSLSNI